MTLYAGHLPTRVFTREEIKAMPFYPVDTGDLAPDGYSLWLTKNHKLVVTYQPPYPARIGGYSFRPIVRVRAAGRHL